MYDDDVSRAQAQALLAKADANGVDSVELVRRLMLAGDLRSWYHQRCCGDGAGRVSRIKLTYRGLELRTWDGETYEYTHEASGARWREASGWISRTRLEEELGVWPGYLDAIEDLYRQVAELNDGLERATKYARDRDAEWFQQLGERERDRWRACRHVELARWRDANPTPTEDVPLALRPVRHIKHIDTVQPCYVYFLLNEGTVVYVGQTASAWPSRILTHLRDGTKTFDDVWCLEVDRPSLNDVETNFIRQYDPVYNRRSVRLLDGVDCESGPGAEKQASSEAVEDGTAVTDLVARFGHSA